MVKSFKYRLRPTKKQEKILLAHIEQCCILYNQLLCERIQAWKKNKESLSRYDQQETLPMLKKQYNPFSLVHSQVLQQVCQRVDWAFKGFFRKEEKSLAKAQRKWDAVKKRPKTDAVRERRRKVIAKVHERIRNKRHNFAHQESRKMVNRHNFIAVEKLDVKEM